MRTPTCRRSHSPHLTQDNQPVVTRSSIETVQAGGLEMARRTRSSSSLPR
ncbi:MAG: hypothetical protein MZV64_23425 [Ignavibacteriales bacterium]|nr:hypothetical protein [Ignavibacteriales bacterium]